MRGTKASAKAVALVVFGATLVCTAALAAPPEFGAWSVAQRVEDIPGTDPSFNGPDLDGCPFISRDGKSFYMASNRPGGLGNLDIWVSKRASVDDPWGAPVNVGAPVNSAANDFCPTIARNGHRFYFVSNREGGCGGADIYTTWLRKGGFDPVRNLGCEVNSAADEASPFPRPEGESGPVLYYSSNRPGGFADDPPGAPIGDADLYVSQSDGGVFGPGALVPGANTQYEDGQPNVRHDGRELFFFSNRPGTLGLADIYAATRGSTSDPWSTPVNLGPNVNSAAGAETRPSLSWDGTTLYFGSTRPGGEGSTDHYVTTRERLHG
jgi:WD40 repeat protein